MASYCVIIINISILPCLLSPKIKSNLIWPITTLQGTHPCLQFPSYHLHGNFCMFIMTPLIQILTLNGLRDELPLWTVEVLILFQCTIHPSSSTHHSSKNTVNPSSSIHHSSRCSSRCFIIQNIHQVSFNCVAHQVSFKHVIHQVSLKQVSSIL